MPMITVKLQTAVRRTFRVEQIAGMFDVPLEELGHALSGRATQGSIRPGKACHPKVRHELVAEVPGMEEKWTIGAIVGPSGSGKTTLAKVAFGGIYKPRAWPKDRAIIDVLGEEGTRGLGLGTGEDKSGKPKAESRGDASGEQLSIKMLTRVLTAVGLGSPPTWLKPYHVLSGGEKFRAELVRALVSSKFKVQSSKLGDSRQLTVGGRAAVLVIDEFTSTLDRTVAKTTSAALSRLLRGAEGIGRRESGVGVRLVAVTCHGDVLPWLQPDWTVELGGRQPCFASQNTATQGAERHGGRSLQGRLIRGRPRKPGFRFRVERVPQAVWTRFSGEHYLSGGLAASASCYAALWNKEPIGFCAVVAALGWKGTKRIQRLVVLPEFQGMGIGGKLLDIVAADQAAKGFRVTITASHPAVLAHCGRSERWRYLEVKKLGSTPQFYDGREVASSVGRAVAAFEYVESRRSKVQGPRSK